MWWLVDSRESCAWGFLAFVLNRHYRDSFHLGGIRAEEKVFQFALKDEYMGFQERKGAGCWDVASRRNSMGKCLGSRTLKSLHIWRVWFKWSVRGGRPFLRSCSFQISRLHPATVNNRFCAFGLVSCLSPCIFSLFRPQPKLLTHCSSHPAELQSATHPCISSLYSSSLTWYFSQGTHERPTLAHVCVLCLFPYSF